VIHHLAFRTHNIERLERFYRDVVGLALLKKDSKSTWLRLGFGTGNTGILMLESRSQTEPEIPPQAMDLTCFAIAPEKAEEIRARLSKFNVPIEGSTPHSLYFRDPDGRRLGVSSYPAPLC
jgi:glyoxylase I family protein